jgi:hypothetical protein
MYVGVASPTTGHMDIIVSDESKLASMEPEVTSARDAAAAAAEEFRDARYYISRILSAESVYEVLDVQHDFNSGIGLSKKKIKDNFFKIALVIHPDRCLIDDATVAFSKLREAYEQINNDLNNPKPFAVPLPKFEAKPRRQVATLTSRMLRGAIHQDMLHCEEGPGKGTHCLSELKHFCEQDKLMSSFGTKVDINPKKGKWSNEFSKSEFREFPKSGFSTSSSMERKSDSRSLSGSKLSAGSGDFKAGSGESGGLAGSGDNSKTNMSSFADKSSLADSFSDFSSGETSPSLEYRDMMSKPCSFTPSSAVYHFAGSGDLCMPMAPSDIGL